MIPFNRPYRAAREMEYISRALAARTREGPGEFTHYCTDLLKRELGDSQVHLTQSCTAALECAAILSGVGPGDEVVMPSFTFVSTANAFVLRGATPVFVDIDPHTQNLDPDATAAALSDRTRAVVLVHYAGISCDMEAFQALASDAEILLVEDAAQAYGSRWKDRPLGGFGDLGAISFHDTKNVSSGEGGALVVNRPDLSERAAIAMEKGTNRAAFLHGAVDKYSWVGVGSSFLPSEITAAMLRAHLEAAETITQKRRAIWSRYDEMLAQPIAESFPSVRTPECPPWASHNGHLYYLILPSLEARTHFIAGMRDEGMVTPFHYVPLHSSPAGRKFGKVSGAMTNTDRAGTCLVRLPLFADLELATVDKIASAVLKTLSRIGDCRTRARP